MSRREIRSRVGCSRQARGPGILKRVWTKWYHAKALETLAKAHEDKPEAKPEVKPEVKPFEPYCLRHTALTDLAGVGYDAFILARIAGHSGIRITERYVHPEEEAVEAAFKRQAAQKVVTNGGHHEKPSLRTARENQRTSQIATIWIAGAPGEARTPDLQIRSLWFP